MTSVEMQYNFELRLGTFHKIEKIFTSKDVETFLNISQDELLRDRYEKNDLSPAVYFESNEKVRTEIGMLISNHTVDQNTIQNNPGKHPNAFYITLPADYLYSIKEECQVNYTDCNGDSITQYTKVVPIRHDEYLANINNPFAKPDYKKIIWRLDYGGTGNRTHEIIGDTESNYNILEYFMRYIKIPVRISIENAVNCELHTSVHDEIVNRAVRLAIASIPVPDKVEQNQES